MKRGAALLLALTFVAFVLRLLPVIAWQEVGGDGPTRAIWAYNWSRAPRLVLHGVWLPGFMYVTGAFSFLVRDPAISLRVFNLVLGTLTIPVFYLLTRRLYGPSAALFSALILALLPLHVGLSATSLTEVSFVFEVLLGTLLFLKAGDEGSRSCLVFALACLVLACATRYEGWLLVPLFPAYHYLRTRDARSSLLVLIVLLAFPLAWLAGNQVYEGSFVWGFVAGAKGTGAAGSRRAGLPEAIGILGGKTVLHLGVLPFAIAPGLAAQLVRALRKEASRDGWLYLGIACLLWLWLLAFAMVRGASLLDRYLLLGVVVSLPFAWLWLAPRFERARSGLGICVVAALVPLGAVALTRRPAVYSLTPSHPVEIERVAAWLKTGPHRDAAVVLTRMRWDSTLLPLYHPAIASRHLIVSGWVSDSTIQRFLRRRRPPLLITRDGDEEHVARVEALLGRKLAGAPIHAEGGVRVHALEP